MTRFLSYQLCINTSTLLCCVSILALFLMPAQTAARKHHYDPYGCDTIQNVVKGRVRLIHLEERHFGSFYLYTPARQEPSDPDGIEGLQRGFSNEESRRFERSALVAREQVLALGHKRLNKALLSHRSDLYLQVVYTPRKDIVWVKILTDRPLRKYMKYDEVARLMDTLCANAHTWNLPDINPRYPYRVVTLPVFNRFQPTNAN